jgi:hypothetical protein
MEAIDSVYTPRVTERYRKIFGEMALGALNLTDANPEGKIQVFVPNGHEGRIRIQLGELPKDAVVTLQAPTGAPKFLKKQGEYSWKISELLTAQNKGENPPGLVEPQPDSKYFSDVYTITLRLKTNRGAENVGFNLTSAQAQQDILAPAQAQKDILASAQTQQDITAAPVLITYIVVIYPPLQSDELP